MDFKSGLLDLPPEILEKMVLGLDHDSILNMCSSHPKIEKFFCSDLTFWKRKANHDYPELKDRIVYLISADSPKDAKESYIILDKIKKSQVKSINEATFIMSILDRAIDKFKVRIRSDPIDAFKEFMSFIFIIPMRNQGNKLRKTYYHRVMRELRMAGVSLDLGNGITIP